MHYINYKRNLLFKTISYEKVDGYNNKKEGVKCMICNQYYFKDNFNYQPYVCNKCHDFSMTVMDLIDFFILNIKNNDYIVYISNIDKKRSYNYFKKNLIYMIKEYYKWILRLFLRLSLLNQMLLL